MLPKLQQSSIAQSLRKDNPATNLQRIIIPYSSLRSAQGLCIKTKQ